MVRDVTLYDWFKTFDPIVYDYRVRYRGFEVLYRIFAYLNNVDPEDTIADYDTAKSASFIIGSMSDEGIDMMFESTYKNEIPYYNELFDPHDFDLDYYKDLLKEYTPEYCENHRILAHGDVRFVISQADMDQLTNENYETLHKIAQKGEVFNPVDVFLDEDESLVVI